MMPAMRDAKRTLPRRQFLSLAAGAAVVKSEWTTLCDGKTLAGWKTEGNAAWSVEDGSIVGRQGPGGSAGDLLTEKQWGNFEFDCEWMMKWPGNSGIWFRYTSAKAAYQADILDQPSHPGVLSGSLYVTGKAFIAENHDAGSVKKQGWNRLNIKVVQDLILIRMNGKLVIKSYDHTFMEAGSLGIQVHPGKEYDGMEIRVRKARVREVNS
jgi:hypothetical protein